MRAFQKPLLQLTAEKYLSPARSTPQMQIMFTRFGDPLYMRQIHVSPLKRVPGQKDNDQAIHSGTRNCQTQTHTQTTPSWQPRFLPAKQVASINKSIPVPSNRPPAPPPPARPLSQRADLWKLREERPPPENEQSELKRRRCGQEHSEIRLPFGSC